MSIQAASFQRLKTAPWNRDAAFLQALDGVGARPQPLSEGTGKVVFDDYSILVDSMPPMINTPEAFLRMMLTNLNATVNDHFDPSQIEWRPPTMFDVVQNPGMIPARVAAGFITRKNVANVSLRFDTMNVFSRRGSGPPRIGEIFDINILGPDDGSVALAELSTDYFVFQTIATKEEGTHPECGAREFGFEHMGEVIRFYTRGVSRPSNVLVKYAGKVPQLVSWSRLMKGISNAIQGAGGVPRASSFEGPRRREVDYDPAWEASQSAAPAAPP